MVTPSMTVIDPWLEFQGFIDIFRHWIFQKRHNMEP